MIFYIVIFAFCFFMLCLSVSVKDEKVKKIISIITLSILCIISGTRYNIGGTDYLAYKSIYDNIPINNFFEQISRFSKLYGVESGFVVYSYIIKIIGFNYYGFTLINSIIFYFVFYKVLSRYKYNINFVILLFLYKMFFYNTFVSMRQPLSILIFWLSIDFLKEKKYIKYFSMCLLAFLFHRGAILLFFIPIITNISFSKRSYFILLIFGLLSYICIRFNFLNINSFVIKFLNILFSNDPSALNRIELYGHSSSSMNIFYTLEYYLIAILLYLIFNKIYNNDKNAKIFINLFICMLPFYTILSSFSVVTRFKDYFFLCYPVMVSYIAKYSKKNDIIIYGFTIIICLYGYTRYILNFDGGSLIPYQSFLFNNISIFR